MPPVITSTLPYQNGKKKLSDNVLNAKKIKDKQVLTLKNMIDMNVKQSNIKIKIKKKKILKNIIKIFLISFRKKFYYFYQNLLIAAYAL